MSNQSDPAVSSIEELLTPEEGAAACKVKIPTFLAWLAAKKLPSLKLSNKTVRVRRRDLEAFLAKAEGAESEARPA